MTHKSTVKPSEPDRKEKVLHTRIPAALEDEIKRLAEALSIPVSNLVRNILQDTVGMIATVKEHVGDAVTDLRAEVDALSTHVARDRHTLRRRWAEYQALGGVRPDPEAEAVETEAEPAPPAEGDAPAPEPAAAPALPEIYGWQPLTLNVDVACRVCNTTLNPGDQAYLGLGAPSASRIFICPACLPRPGERRST
ncbi:MAG TPA: hypothetical protein VGQ83_26605 [Polyangia bacterium]